MYKSYLRTYIFYVIIFFWTILIGVTGLILLALFWGRNPFNYRRISKFWCGGLVKILYFLGLRYRVLGSERIVFGGALYASLHQSWWETFALAYLLNDVVFVLKSSLLKIPIIGHYMSYSGMIGIDRASGTRSLRIISSRCSSALSSGSSIVIFPEGSRADIRKKLKLKRGILYLYKSCGVSVIPVALNSGLYWSKRGLIDKGIITLEFLPAIKAGLSDDIFLDSLHSSLSDASLRLAKKTDKF